jgi:UrcA family protein
MNSHRIVLTAKSYLCIAALSACAALSSPARAGGHEVTIVIPIDHTGLDISQPTGAQEYYHRLQKAAFIACRHGNRVDLLALSDPWACYQKAIGDAVRAASQPQLTMIYLKTHTSLEAAAYGIESPVVAAK